MTSILAAEFRRFEPPTRPKIGRLFSSEKVPTKLTPSTKLVESKESKKLIDGKDSKKVIEGKESKKLVERKGESKKLLEKKLFKCPHCSFTDEGKIVVKQVRHSKTICLSKR
jgi:hypothetical protein